MRIKKFQNPAGPLLRNYVAQNDITYVPKSRIIQKYELPGYITLTNGTKVKPDNTVTKISPQSNILPQQQAYYNAVGKEKDKKEKQEQKIKEAGKITLGALDAIATLPSRTIGAVKDAKSGNKSFVSSIIEGNEGLGDEELNTLANFIGPTTFTKGLQIFPKGVQTAARFAASPHTGKWTQIGNRAYRLKPGLAGMNNIQIERRALINPEDLNQRKFFSIEEYGPEPIYTRETVPKDIELKRDWNANPLENNPNLDITYMDYNFDRNHPMTASEVFKDASERFKSSAHGRVIGFDEHRSLSSDSYPLTLAFYKRWQQGNKGQFFIPKQLESTPKIILNHAGKKPINQETVNWLNQKIKESGFDLPQAELIEVRGKQEIAVSPVGFFKFKNGRKIYANKITT